MVPSVVLHAQAAFSGQEGQAASGWLRRSPVEVPSKTRKKPLAQTEQLAEALRSQGSDSTALKDVRLDQRVTKVCKILIDIYRYLWIFVDLCRYV